MDRYFYSVEMDGDRKVVHLFGNVYHNDVDETEACYRHAEWTGLYLTPEEILNLFKELYLKKHDEQAEGNFMGNYSAYMRGINALQRTDYAR